LEKKLAAGWYRYQFPELGVHIDLPEKPETGKLEHDIFSNLATRGWACYELEGDDVGFDMWAYRYRRGYEGSLESDAESLVDSGIEGGPVYKLKSKQTTHVDGEEAISVAVTYREKETKDQTTVDFLCLRNGGLTLWLRVYYYSDHKPGKVTADRIFRSIRLSPPKR